MLRIDFVEKDFLLKLVLLFNSLAVLIPTPLSVIIHFKFCSCKNSILISGLISKGVFTVFYSLLFYIYLKYFDSKEPFTSLLKLKDVFQTLSYKQKFNDVQSPNFYVFKIKLYLSMISENFNLISIGCQIIDYGNGGRNCFKIPH